MCRVHCRDYIARVHTMSDDETKMGHTCGDVATFAPGAYSIATLAAGGAIVATDAVLDGYVRNAYALVRPPGTLLGEVHALVLVTRMRGVTRVVLPLVCMCTSDAHVASAHGNNPQFSFPGHVVFMDLAVAWRM